MTSEKETVKDIVKEMHTLGRLDEKSTDKIPRTLQALGLRTYADRIEAAHKREVEVVLKDRDEMLKSEQETVAKTNEWFDEYQKLKREVAELLECLEQAYGDKIGTYTMKGNEVERWRKALKGAKDEGM